MGSVTGLVATLLVFWSGPYHALQIRWPTVWGRRLSTTAHSNLSLAAAVVVLLHIGLEIGVSLTWIGTWLFLAVVISGLYGLYVATGARRAGWLRRQRNLSYAFYITILPHVIGSLFGWAVIGGLAMGWAVWRWRDPIRDWLSRAHWPLAHPEHS